MGDIRSADARVEVDAVVVEIGNCPGTKIRIRGCVWRGMRRRVRRCRGRLALTALLAYFTVFRPNVLDKVTLAAPPRLIIQLCVCKCVCMCMLACVCAFMLSYVCVCFSCVHAE